MEVSWLVWALLSAVFAALTTVFAKLGLQGIHPDLATFWRTLMITLILALFVGVGGTWRPPTTLGRSTWFFLCLSAVATGCSWVCYFRALHGGNVAQVASIDKLSLVFAAILAALFLSERISVRETIGVIVMTVGMILMALKKT